jgi:hypothetical protein
MDIDGVKKNDGAEAMGEESKEDNWAAKNNAAWDPSAAGQIDSDEMADDNLGPQNYRESSL